MGKTEAKVNGSSSVHSVSHGTQKSGPTEAHHQTKVQITSVFTKTLIY